MEKNWETNKRVCGKKSLKTALFLISKWKENLTFHQVLMACHRNNHWLKILTKAVVYQLPSILNQRPKIQTLYLMKAESPQVLVMLNSDVSGLKKKIMDCLLTLFIDLTFRPVTHETTHLLWQPWRMDMLRFDNNLWIGFHLKKKKNLAGGG